jgi:hypothetical protein
MIGTFGSLKAVNKFQTYHMLMFSQHLYVTWTIAKMKSWFWETKQITVQDTASNSGISLESVEKIVHEHLLFKKVCASCVSEMWTFDQKAQVAAVSIERLHWCQLAGNSFLEWIMTRCEMCALLHTRVKAVQRGMVSQGISTIQKNQGTAVSWLDHGKYVLGFRWIYSCWFSSTWWNN